jgi:CubicO group peptidase (beta-lactamase class C family)
VLALAGAGLTMAMPVEPGMGQMDWSQAAGPPELGPLLPDVYPLGPGPLVSQQILPEPEPVALRARELNDWVDAVLQDRPTQEDDVWSAIDTCVLEDMAGNPDNPADDTPAASIAVALNGVITYTKGYGVKDLQQGGEVDADTMFPIGSTTKMMTAGAIMQLRERGEVDLEAPITSYLPEYQLGHPWSSDDITLHYLMSHQTGIIDYYFVQDTSMPLMSWVQAVGTYSLPLYAAPGSYWNYANPNFSLAGAVVERLSGETFNEYLTKSVWGPAGMPLTTLATTDVISTGNYVTGYHNGQAVPTQEYDIPWLGPAGTAWSTPTELVTWTLQLQAEGGDVMNGESARLMQERHVNAGYQPWFDYGYGVMINDYKDTEEPDQRITVYDHGGNIGGGSSQLFWVPERGVSFSILASTIRSLNGAAMCTLKVLADLEPIPGEETQPETWDAHVGTYSMMDLFLWPWTGNVRRYSDTLTLGFNDILGSPMLAGPNGNMQLHNAFGDVFVADGPSMVAPGVDFSFIRDPEDNERVRFMRNRNLVGQRVGQFPESVTIEGESCSPVSFKSELDMPVLSISASGLVTPTYLISVPLTADDPNDPSSASLRYDLEIGEGGSDLVYVLAETEPDDAVGLYLVYDANEDGDFTWDEVVGEGTGTLGATMLYANAPQRISDLEGTLPAGDYQLWVWGAYVQGEDSVLDLYMKVMQGNHLRLENRPRGLIDGAEWEMQVCADDMGDADEPMMGMIQFEYDSPPRVFRIMVDWKPAAEPPATPAVYLPFNVTG